MADRFNIPEYNTISDKTLGFFTKMKQYIDREMFFYGSIMRRDYNDGESDIDVAIFSDNEQSTISRLQHFLKVKRSLFHKIIWKLNGNTITGYKIKCDDFSDINCELSIYDSRFKELIIEEQCQRPLTWGWWIYAALFIIKFIYYKLHLVDKHTYAKMKRGIMNYEIESDFTVIK